MKHKRNTRRVLARGRRMADVTKYAGLESGSKVPQMLDGVTYTDQQAWDKLIARKLKLARDEVKALDSVIE